MDIAQLMGEMIASLVGHNDVEASDFKERAKAAVAGLADELAARERLWATVAKLSGAAAYAVGVADQSSQGNETVGSSQAERAQELFDAATDFAGVVPLVSE